MLEFLFLSLMGLGAGVIIRVIFESTTGGDSIVFGNSPTHRLYKNNAEARTRDLLKNGTGSSKEELQEWWDTYHKK